MVNLHSLGASQKVLLLTVRTQSFKQTFRCKYECVDRCNIFWYEQRNQRTSKPILEVTFNFIFRIWWSSPGVNYHCAWFRFGSHQTNLATSSTCSYKSLFLKHADFLQLSHLYGSTSFKFEIVLQDNLLIVVFLNLFSSPALRRTRFRPWETRGVVYGPPAKTGCKALVRRRDPPSPQPPNPSQAQISWHLQQTHPSEGPTYLEEVRT